MRIARWLVPAAVGLTLAACGEQSPPLPTQSPRLNHVVGGQCDPALATQIYSGIDVVFSGQQRSRARRLFGDVESTCSTQATAIANLMTFVKYTIAQKSQINSTAGATLLARYQALVSVWDQAFVFVGVESPTDATGVDVALALTDAGAAGVFNSGVLVTQTAFAGLNALAGYPSERLWLIVPITCPANSGLTGLCFDFSVHPFDGVNEQLVNAGLCPLNTAGSLHVRRELAYTFNDALQFKIPPPKSNPGFVLDCDAAPTAAVEDGESWWQYATVEPSLMTRLAGALGRLVGPKSLYAIHGGLHSTTTTRSGSFTGRPWGVVDPLIFDDDFENDVVGQPPFRPNVGEILANETLPAPWTILLQSPASVLVQSSFADITSKVAVIDQKGGASENSAPLTFFARVLGTPPFRGRVAARWQAVISSSTMRSPAPVVIRSFDGLAEVGRVEYRPGKSAKSGPIFFNGTSVGTWKQGVSQYFELLVDLDTDVTELFIGTSGWPGSSVGTSTTTAGDVGRWGVELGGQDAQQFGVDNISVNLRPLLSDAPPAP